MDRTLNTIGKLSPYAALVVATVAMAGSLFFSQVLGWLPCEMCWYQRIAMYPLVFILFIGILRRDEKMWRYVIPIALIGAAISSYHILYQKTDWFTASPCELNSGVSCKGDYLNWLNGLITIPTLALIAFVMVILGGVASQMSMNMAMIDDEDAGDDEVAAPSLASSAPLAAPEPRSAFWIRFAGAALAIGAAIAIVFTVGADLRASRPPKTTELPGVKPVSPFATPAVSVAGGATFFRDYCAMCHGSNGDGINGLAPTLAGSTLVKFGTEDELLRMIRKGRLPNDADNKSGLQMPQSGGMASYTDDEVRSVIRYMKTIVR